LAGESDAIAYGVEVDQAGENVYVPATAGMRWKPRMEKFLDPEVFDDHP
jgi:hypothetical protein